MHSVHTSLSFLSIFALISQRLESVALCSNALTSSSVAINSSRGGPTALCNCGVQAEPSANTAINNFRTNLSFKFFLFALRITEKGTNEFYPFSAARYVRLTCEV